MPEMHFQIRWPDGTEAACYSPSLVVKKYLTVGETYTLSDFLERSRTALNIASDRVQAKFGFPCGLAMGQIREIETTAAKFQTHENPQVSVLAFTE